MSRADGRRTKPHSRRAARLVRARRSERSCTAQRLHVTEQEQVVAGETPPQVRERAARSGPFLLPCSGLLALFLLDLDDDETVGLADDPPTMSTSRLMAGGDDPPMQIALIDLILLSPGHLDNCRAVGGTALAPTCAQPVESILGRRIGSHARNLPNLGSGLAYQKTAPLINMITITKPTKTTTYPLRAVMAEECVPQHVSESPSRFFTAGNLGFERMSTEPGFSPAVPGS